MPKCTKACQRERACGHVDVLQHPCHEGACPPCAALVIRECDGGHGNDVPAPCHVQTRGCGKMCDKLLQCQQHRCKRRCHRPPCVAESTAVGADDGSGGEARVGLLEQARESCGARCDRQRVLCTHGCAAPCHPGEACPDVVCEERVVVHCACGRRSQTTVCGRGGPADHTPVQRAPPAAAATDDDDDDNNDDNDNTTVAVAHSNGDASHVGVASSIVLSCDEECVGEIGRASCRERV